MTAADNFNDIINTKNIFVFFFFNDTATTEIYTLSLHDALPIFDEAFVETLIELRSNAGASLARYTALLDPSGYKAASSVPATTQTQKPARPETPTRGEKPAPTLSREKALRFAQGRRGTRAGNPNRHEGRGFVGMTFEEYSGFVVRPYRLRLCKLGYLGIDPG